MCMLPTDPLAHVREFRPPIPLPVSACVALPTEAFKSTRIQML